MTDRAGAAASAAQEMESGAAEGPAQPGESVSDAPAEIGLAAVSQFYTYRLHKLSVLLGRQMHDELRARYSLKLADWRTIGVLGEFGPLSLVDVARRGAIDKAQVSRLLPGLIRRGYIARAGHPTDRRRASLRLTDTGRELYGEILVLGRRRQAWLVEELTEAERGTVVDCLDRLLKRIEAEPVGPFARPASAPSTNSASGRTI